MSPLQILLMLCRKGKKVKDCNSDDFVILYNKIAEFTGVKHSSANESLENSIIFSKLLKDVWPNKFIKEVAGSYYCALHGHLVDNENNVIKLFPMIDIRTCSELVRSFDVFFKKTFELELKNQRFWYEEQQDTKPSEEEIYKSFLHCLKQALETIKNKKEYQVSGSDLFLYSELKNRQIINISIERNKIEIDLATKKFKSELLQQKIDPSATLGKRAEFSHLLENILPNDLRIVNVAKRKILNDYLKEFVEQDLTIEEILKNN